MAEYPKNRSRAFLKRKSLRRSLFHSLVQTQHMNEKYAIHTLTLRMLVQTCGKKSVKTLRAAAPPAAKAWAKSTAHH
eukprot:5061743-Amphidinium_carterae.1